MTDKSKISQSPNDPADKDGSGAAINQENNENKGNRILENAKRRSVSLGKQESSNYLPVPKANDRKKGSSKGDRIRERALRRSTQNWQGQTESQTEKYKPEQLHVEQQRIAQPQVELRKFAEPQIEQQETAEPHVEKQESAILQAEQQKTVAPQTENLKPTEPRVEKQETSESQVEQKEIAESQVDEQVVAKLRSEQRGPTNDDLLLTDIRRSLVEEATEKQKKKQRGVLGRVSNLFKPDKALPKEDANLNEPALEKVDLTAGNEGGEITKQVVEEQDILSSSAVEAFFAGLIESSKADEQAENVAVIPVDAGESDSIPAVESVVIPAEESHLGEHATKQQPDEKVVAEKTQVGTIFRPQTEKGKFDTDLDAIREVALEDYGTLERPENIPTVTWQRRVKIIYKGLKPFERNVIFSVIGLIFLAGLLSVGLLIKNIQDLQPAQQPPKPTLNLPFPVRVTLPGGWAFDLHKGKVIGGRWNPAGAEWLDGTELCKWVAVPWSLQLEAVLRTLKSNDPVELTMSNTDKLTFKVQSIKEVPVDQIGTLEKTSNCLLLILAKQNSETRWVVTTIP